jgi:hypothetical protein
MTGVETDVATSAEAASVTMVDGVELFEGAGSAVADDTTAEPPTSALDGEAFDGT